MREIMRSAGTNAVQLSGEAARRVENLATKAVQLATLHGELGIKGDAFRAVRDSDAFAVLSPPEQAYFDAVYRPMFEAAAPAIADIAAAAAKGPQLRKTRDEVSRAATAILAIIMEARHAPNVDQVFWSFELQRYPDLILRHALGCAPSEDGQYVTIAFDTRTLPVERTSDSLSLYDVTAKSVIEAARMALQGEHAGVELRAQTWHDFNRNVVPPSQSQILSGVEPPSSVERCTQAAEALDVQLRRLTNEVVGVRYAEIKGVPSIQIHLGEPVESPGYKQLEGAVRDHAQQWLDAHSFGDVRDYVSIVAHEVTA